MGPYLTWGRMGPVVVSWSCILGRFRPFAALGSVLVDQAGVVVAADVG